MLFRRKIKISDFLSLLAIVLICLLVTNGIVNAVYIGRLKQRMKEMANAELVIQAHTQKALSSLLQTRLNLVTYINYLETEKADPQKTRVITDRIRAEFQKNEVNLSAAVLSLQKELSGKNVSIHASDLMSLSTRYLLGLEEIFKAENPLGDPRLKDVLSESLSLQRKMKMQLDLLSDSFRSRVAELNRSEDLVLQYFPLILGIVFIFVVSIGAVFIDKTRRQVKDSILENTSVLLSEAFEYEKSCLESLELCQGILSSGISDLKSFLQDLERESRKFELAKKIQDLQYTFQKLESTIEYRQNMHLRDIKRLKDSLKIFEKSGKIN